MNNERIRLDNSGDSSFVMSFDHALRSDMSAKAKGYYLILCALSEKNRYVTRKQILAAATDGIRSYNSGMKELRDTGYVSRDFVRDEKGKITASEIVFHKNAPIGQPKSQPVDKPTLDSESPKASLSDFPHPPPPDNSRTSETEQNQVSKKSDMLRPTRPFTVEYEQWNPRRRQYDNVEFMANLAPDNPKQERL